MNKADQPPMLGPVPFGSFARDWSGRWTSYALLEHEQAVGLERLAEPWAENDVLAELARRVEFQLGAADLVVPYYRIGYDFAFKLPLDRRPDGFPEGVVDGQYPWLIWLGWALEERWRTFAAGARMLSERGPEVVELLTEELAALGRWENYYGDAGEPSLITASIASALADVLLNSDDLGSDVVHVAATTAERIVDEAWPWFTTTWGRPLAGPFEPKLLHNIPCITLVRCAQLATAVGSSRADPMQERSRQVFDAWIQHRGAPTRMTEGPAYDGFLLDSITEWLDARTDADELRAAGSEALCRLVPDWASLTLPGRVDLLAPLGDVEGEMQQWAAVAARVCRWYGQPDAVAWFRRFPLVRLPATALGYAAELAAATGCGESAPELPVRRQEQTSSVTLRTGWTESDILVAVGASRTQMFHLHHDGGHVVLGWKKRFWITDPGYQQYRQGLERQYTLGADAHNAPVIAGKAQHAWATRVMPSGATDLSHHVAMDLTRCYQDLPPDAEVARDIWLLPDASCVVVRDAMGGMSPRTEISTYWLAGAGLAWAFVDGNARLTDGSDAMWIHTPSSALSGEQIYRHPGTRGSLHLRHAMTVDSNGQNTQWWVFCIDPNAGWSPPSERIAAALKTLDAEQ